MLLKDLVAEDVDAVVHHDSYTSIIDLLQQLGVDVVQACKFAHEVRKPLRQLSLSSMDKGA